MKGSPVRIWASASLSEPFSTAIALMPGALARRLAGTTGSRQRPRPQRKERKQQITFETVRRERAEDAACRFARPRRARPFRPAAERPCAPRRVPAGPTRVRQLFFRRGELMYVVTKTGGGSKEFEPPPVGSGFRPSSGRRRRRRW